jgi:cell division protein FtsX
MNHWKNLIVRSAREGTVQLVRNKFLSSTTILLGALILFLLNFIFALSFFTDFALKDLESRADFRVPLEAQYEVFNLEALQNDLTNQYQVQTSVLPAEDFLNFSNPPILYIKFESLRDVAGIFELLKSVRYSEVIGEWDFAAEREFVTLVDRLLGLRDTVEQATFWLIILFVLGGIALAVNTFRVVLFSRRQEVFVARLVGADTTFIAGPYLWEGLLLGLISWLVAGLGFVLVLREIDFLPGQNLGGEIFEYWWNFILWNELLIAMGVGVLGAWIAIKRYLTGHFEA